MKKSAVFLILLLAVQAQASRLYDPFEGGKINCHLEDSSNDRLKEIFFSADMTLPYADKMAKFKPNKIFLMTASYVDEGFIFTSRKFIEADEFTLYSRAGDKVTVCGQTFAESRCKFNGGDDNGKSPEMVYYIDCAADKSRKGASQDLTAAESVVFRMQTSESNILELNCEADGNKTFFNLKIPDCNRTEIATTPKR
ncbi:MAG: hypothetical protein ABL958_03870 [Bdellovibrionia bacterium]